MSQQSNDVRAAFNGHHLWCNGMSRGPVKGCRWCDPDGDGKRGLWALYPYDTGAEANNLHTKHFPDAVERTGTGYKFPESEQSPDVPADESGPPNLERTT